MNSTVIISDSRGVGLQEQLEKKYNNVCVVVKRSAELETSVTAALTVIRARLPKYVVEVEVEWGFYALSASKAIFRARTYNCNLFSPVMMIT